MSKKHLIAVLVGLFVAGPVQAQSAYKIVGHPTGAAASITKKDVSRFFLKKTTRWGDGTQVVVVDNAPSSQVREAFSLEILGKKVSNIETYWLQQVFSGRAVPPEVRNSDAEIVEFIRSQPGAIGYVSADTPVDGLTVIEIS